MEYLSPTSLRLWDEDRERFYLQYILRVPRGPQTEPMSVGSAFDAYVKTWMAAELKIPGPSFSEMFEAQVEEANRDFARAAGLACFEAYQLSGALSDLMLELDGCTSVGFETTVRGEVSGVPFLGKPDVHAILPDGATFIVDWKVNGYCSKASPKPGYMLCRDGWSGDHSRSHMKSHKDYHPMIKHGLKINAGSTLSDEWAAQTCIYSWLIGCDVGDDFIVGIDQLACNDGKVRVASFRNTVSAEWQRALHARAVACWEAVCAGEVLPAERRAELECCNKGDGFDFFI